MHVRINDILQSQSENDSKELSNNIIDIARTCQTYNIGKIFIPSTSPSRRFMNTGSINNKPSVIKQKGESQKGCFKKTKHTYFPKKEHFLPIDTHLACFVLWKHPFWDSPFCLITTKLKQLYQENNFAVIDNFQITSNDPWKMAYI